VVLALGIASLLAGCAEDRGVATWRGAGELPGDSHTDSPTPSATPSPESSWQVPPANQPTPGVCPTVPGIVQHRGGPQFYLPCNATNVALTIDDGPDPEWTSQILTLLATYKIKATFCMIGRKAAANPGLVAAVVDGGHQVANHSFTHPLNLFRLPVPQVRAEIARANDVIGTATGGHRPTLFRAPGGAWSPAVLSECAAQGVRPLDWSVDPRDWSRPGVQHIVSTILTKTHPGSIILEHDGGGNRAQTVAALKIALPRLVDAGYTFTQP
jgi:peptidoglycan/xylan/chitin deacetylase (PgdA/CDA1 family)